MLYVCFCFGEMSNQSLAGVEVYAENLVWQTIHVQGTYTERLDIILSLNAMWRAHENQQGEHDACRCRHHSFDIEIHHFQDFCLMRYLPSYNLIRNM